tara:strand:- start:11736 stop:13247 length:1512 start_codon:yes stop_codon:yes gene_type:complete
MSKKCHFWTLLFILFITSINANAQQFEEMMSRGQIKGNFQFESQFYREDTIIGAEEVPERIRSNSFLNLIYSNGGFSAGMRYESYLPPLLGYPEGYQGNGIMYRFASYQKDDLSITVGNFYEQFGTGLVLRTYEERGLGYDNALDGVRLKYKVYDGIRLTALTGRQRIFFDYGEGIVRGFDADINLNETFSDFFEGSKTRILLGGSAVSKYQADRNSQFVLPENVATFGGRASITRGRFNFYAEYAYKVNDPSADNEFIYKPGEALLLQGTYSQKGLGILVSAKRNDNMSFRSDRTEGEQNLLINYMPALTKQHTYNLLATLYPYATQLNGEVAFQADLIYKFDKGTILGGDRGMDIQVNYSTANNIDTTHLNDEFTFRQGYKSSYFSVGEVYFKDFNVQLTKRFSSKVKGIFTYANLVYNQDIIEGKPGAPTVYADIAIADITYRLDMRNALRGEFQHLSTEQDQGDWATLLVEYTYAPHWFIAIQDQYNYGNSEKEKQTLL